MTSGATIRELLGATSLPAGLVDGLLSEASRWWLAAEPAAVLAGEVALCHPPLRSGEVRAAVRATSHPNRWRLAIVGRHRPGLLATLADALEADGLLMQTVTATRWSEGDLTLVGARIVDPLGKAGRADFERVRTKLHAAPAGTRLPRRRRPCSRVEVEVHPQWAGGSLVVVQAPRSPGLLAAAVAWLAGHGCPTEAAYVEPSHAFRGALIVSSGRVDATGLARYLAGSSRFPHSAGFAPAGLGRVRAWRDVDDENRSPAGRRWAWASVAGTP